MFACLRLCVCCKYSRLCPSLSCVCAFACSCVCIYVVVYLCICMFRPLCFCAFVCVLLRCFVSTFFLFGVPQFYRLWIYAVEHSCACVFVCFRFCMFLHVFCVRAVVCLCIRLQCQATFVRLRRAIIVLYMFLNVCISAGGHPQPTSVSTAASSDNTLLSLLPGCLLVSCWSSELHTLLPWRWLQEMPPALQNIYLTGRAGQTCIHMCKADTQAAFV